MTRIFYVVPDIHRKRSFSLKGLLKHLVRRDAMDYLYRCVFRLHKPVGGVKVIYQHCIMLRNLGYDAKPLLMGDYHGNFFHFDIPTVKLKDVKDSIGCNDIVVATEFAPYQGLLFEHAAKLLFLQNWIGLRKWLKNDDKDKTYLQLGYDHVITCSQFCSDYVVENMNIPAETITNGIDLSLFKPDEQKRIPNKILALSRKNPLDLEKIQASMAIKGYEITVVDGLTQSELIAEYQSSDIFVATGYPEGFSLPPLEAMACGCVVVGFTGGAGKEFMLHDKTALVSEDGDCDSVSAQLFSLLENPKRKEELRKNSSVKACEYSLDNTQQQLANFYKVLIDSLN